MSTKLIESASESKLEIIVVPNQAVVVVQPEQKICRICLDNNPENDLISPCRCSGNSKYVHKQCLLSWVNQKPNFLFSGRDCTRQCDECRYRYKVIRQRVIGNKNKLFINVFLGSLLSIGLFILSSFIVGVLVSSVTNTNLDFEPKTTFYTGFIVFYISLALVNFFVLMTFAIEVLSNQIFWVTACFLIPMVIVTGVVSACVPVSMIYAVIYLCKSSYDKKVAVDVQPI
jgi:hypothetical protein